MCLEATVVRMAGIGFAGPGAVLRTTLGSCVAVIVRDRDLRMAGLAHVMLPRRPHDGEPAGKYADSAIAELLEGVLSRGGRRSSLQAWLAGGARIFPIETGLGAIGEQNVASARLVLQEAGVPVVHEQVGGCAGRIVTFNPATGEISVQSLAPLGGAS